MKVNTTLPASVVVGKYDMNVGGKNELCSSALSL